MRTLFAVGGVKGYLHPRNGSAQGKTLHRSSGYGGHGRLGDNRDVAFADLCLAWLVYQMSLYYQYQGDNYCTD
ncbi:hypothetical protein CGMCC3_g5752 [Colletotrichum fructicola]|uniref:Uncharacterized protein n=1 Tax=Colletotrichum fructicola (strain Nara gc5) TaxID=1213859 RepID=A0A7J6IV07_COLFN|nr:uncharacterized protein CGMCC3_g5752 [Colletotrichum fructicola]KAE9578534.1 hypothetical protein CGMCC3_g5752 [Colletotrichum fructicola]KAF4480326.1 hypothetical protein CGGC5_v011236 [Colletotrichum fructicola Nara gc5]